jgi:2-isopropylmalate synthase
VKALEARGYTFDAADASFELLLLQEAQGERASFFDVESWRVITDSHRSGNGASKDDLALSEATVKLVAGGKRVVATGEGNGPVNALDHALREALLPAYPELERLRLIDFRVRILDASSGTDATTRVLIETSDGETSWETVGVAPNIVEASWEALVDGVTYGLVRQGVERR